MVKILLKFSFFSIFKKFYPLFIRTQNVIDFQNRQPSVKKSQKLQEIKDQFDNIMNEGAINVHKKLEELIKLEFF